MSVANKPLEPPPKARWYRFTADRFVVGWLFLQCLLWLSERNEWFPFNAHKGRTLLLALVSVGAAMLVTVSWFIASLLLRWRFQFSIRSLLLLAVAIAVPSSWLAVESKSAKKQREAVATLRNLEEDVKVYYEYQAFGPASDFFPDHESPWGAYLHRQFGIDFAYNVVAVEFGGHDFSGTGGATVADIRVIAELKHLVYFVPPKWGTDAALAHVAGITSLREVNWRRRKSPTRAWPTCKGSKICAFCVSAGQQFPTTDFPP